MDEKYENRHNPGDPLGSELWCSWESGSGNSDLLFPLVWGIVTSPYLGE